ncbi:MAG: serine acetyltransferase [Candidatus Margulisbacteria bacterium]|nr:serine acetyltransferase [Candidatus Margulisiibacteriota bacterium]
MTAKREQTLIIKQLMSSYERIGGINHLDGTNLPSKESVRRILNRIKELIFPGYFENVYLDTHNLGVVTGQKVVEVMDRLLEEIEKSILWESKTIAKKTSLKSIGKKAAEITLSFAKEIPSLREILKDDVAAIYTGDPAANSEPDIIFSYPGFQAITVYRIAHFLFKKGVPLIPRMMTEMVHSDTGIDIHPGAKIGHRFCIDHGTGVVIGETAIIGNNVKLYQGVTIGALSIPDRDSKGKRHPTLKDNVTIYARTTILGGKTVIGENTVIGGNAWIIKSIPENTTLYVANAQKHIYKEGK